MRLSLSTRIFLGFALMVACFGAAALYGVAAVTSLRHELTLLRKRALPLLGTLRDNGLELRGFDDALARAAPHDLDWVARFVPSARPFERLDRIMAQIDQVQAVDRPPRLARALVPSPEPLPAIGSTLVATRTAREAARRIGHNPELLAMLPGEGTPTSDAEAFERLTGGLQRAVAEKRYRDASRLVVECRRVVRRVHTAIGRAETQFESALQDRFATAERSEQRLVVVVVMSSAAALGVSVLVLLMMLATLRPMGQLAEVVRRFAGGDRKARAELRGATEIRTLAEETNRMADALEAREQQISAAREELARSERLAAVGQLAARMAHEVRNPLSSIGLNAELLGDELEAAGVATGEGSEARELLDAIGAEVERLREVTERYLERARPAHQGSARLDVGELVGRVVDFAGAETEQRGVHVRIDAVPGCEVEADERSLRQTLWNLLRNAWEAMPEGGDVAVRVWQDAGEVVVTVEDDGPGIAEEAAARLFEPFFTTKERGTGVGLAVVRETVRAHGGSVRVLPPDRLGGARFEFRLPRVAAGEALDG
ncbi:MAG: sensor histidine kinase [Pseudomonadota bacterium]